VRPLAPSRVDACNPLLQAHPTRARDKHEGRGIPPLTPVSLRLPPPFTLCTSHDDPSGLGHAAIIYSSVQEPPGVETPTSLYSSSVHGLAKDLYEENRNLPLLLAIFSKKIIIKQSRLIVWW
jgi:hypothetical protein